jgi:hypothetical protein
LIAYASNSASDELRATARARLGEYGRRIAAGLDGEDVADDIREEVERVRRVSAVVLRG